MSIGFREENRLHAFHGNLGNIVMCRGNLQIRPTALHYAKRRLRTRCTAHFPVAVTLRML